MKTIAGIVLGFSFVPMLAGLFIGMALLTEYFKLAHNDIVIGLILVFVTVLIGVAFVVKFAP